MQTLREQADAGEPQPLVTGYGDYLGLWAVTKVDETRSEPTPFGATLKQEFSLELHRVVEDIF